MAEIAPEYNAKIIEEFRASRGRAGGTWEETPPLLLHHTGAKSGVSRANAVAYLPDGSRHLVWAANGGAPNHPDWYRILMARPNTRIEVGSETIDVWRGGDGRGARAPLRQSSRAIPATRRNCAEH
jgi:deazaflavin-dependent oxidoreductase (nitroreductase family)